MLKRLIEHFKSHDGVEFATFYQIADDFLAANPRDKK